MYRCIIGVSASGSKAFLPAPCFAAASLPAVDPDEHMRHLDNAAEFGQRTGQTRGRANVDAVAVEWVVDPSKALRARSAKFSKRVHLLTVPSIGGLTREELHGKLLVATVRKKYCAT